MDLEVLDVLSSLVDYPINLFLFQRNRLVD